MITLNTDIHISFDEVRLKMMQHLDGKKEELIAIVQDAIDNFDFKSTLQEKTMTLIEDALDEAYEEIDLSDTIKDIVWKEVEKRLKNEKER